MSVQPRASTTAIKSNKSATTATRENTPVNNTQNTAKRMTRANSALSLSELRKLSFEQLYEVATDSQTKDVNYAREVLDKGGYYVRDAPVTSLTIATLLMTFVAFNEDRPLNKGARTVLSSIAMMLANEDTSTTTGMIALKVTDMTEGMLEEVRKATERLDAATSTMLQTVEEADAAAERLAKEADAVAEKLGRQAEKLFGDQGRMMEITETAEATLSTLQEHTGRLEERLATFPASTHPHLSPEAWPSLPTQQMPTPPPEVIIRHTAAERNVVFDLSPIAAADARDLNEEELVQRANLAVNKMGNTAGKPHKMVFAAATKLAHGGIRYRMHDATCAIWIKTLQVKELFLKEFFGGAGSLKNRHFAVIVEFVPVRFNVENPEEMREMERMNGLAEGSVVGCRWLKNPKARRQDQRFAFLEVACADPESATRLIRNGTIMEGKILITRKKLIEPERCMKCQTSGHKALRCRAKNDICALCADTHRTSECSADTKKCTNCISENNTSKHDHHASDRACPVYLRQVELMRQRHPNNQYRFFPVISDPTTWDTGDYHPRSDPNQWYGSRRTSSAAGPPAPNRRSTPAWTSNQTPRASQNIRPRSSSNASWKSDMSMGTQRSLRQTTINLSSWASRANTPTSTNANA
jgi:cell division septum initiation protein DivIVA